MVWRERTAMVKRKNQQLEHLRISSAMEITPRPARKPSLPVRTKEYYVFLLHWIRAICVLAAKRWGFTFDQNVWSNLRSLILEENPPVKIRLYTGDLRQFRCIPHGWANWSYLIQEKYLHCSFRNSLKICSLKSILCSFKSVFCPLRKSINLIDKPLINRNCQ